MHYKKSHRNKIVSPSFYLDFRLLKELKNASELENISQAQLVECALRFYSGEDYERARKKSFKTKKKVFTPKSRVKKAYKKCKDEYFKQKCLFDSEFECVF
ncbi:hypothetical protein [Campylobacter cuniculorum]|uniref:Uncharacterized protein n=2 Tax=Campylobacter cuniculorum TaxID=374106 RepID=A0A1W6BV16_9BACT|nr:hypothetical protein [Campylobacter cuniculorum]ARJ55943.1 hypothetical protein CCUN_0288 [Campylobacter cuniculorum DSM 23162 = LMG 24588]QOR05161.1 hypothetical protein A0071_04310 [Campylobacter cuniculorum]